MVSNVRTQIEAITGALEEQEWNMLLDKITMPLLKLSGGTEIDISEITSKRSDFLIEFNDNKINLGEVVDE